LSATPVPVGIDFNVLLNTILGGIIAISGSLAVAALYISNQNKNQKKRYLRELIQKDYFDQCLNPVLGALSEYAISTVFALTDARIVLGRAAAFKEITPEEVKKQLTEISNRPILMDLTSHKFSSISKYFPALQKFGLPIHASIIRTLQFYSSVANDGVSYSALTRLPDSAEVARSLGVVAQIIEQSWVFLNKRIVNLRDYFLVKELKSYSDFSKVFSEKEYDTFLSVITQYMEGLTQLMDALNNPTGDRAGASLTFSKWLNDNREINPFETSLSGKNSK
jgi:hypothetical protein